ncbi:MAG: hypothetical protein IPH94_20550 [Saprospiraceae bacterium]|nr:hypothetical protein [Saprospiraceae bacterium]
MKVSIWTFLMGCVLFIVTEKKILSQSILYDKQIFNEYDFGKAQSLNLPENAGVIHKNWMLDIGGGLISGPYVTQLKDVLKDLGLLGCYDTFFGQECYPKDNLAVGFTVALTRDISNKISLGIAATRSIISGVEGFNNGITASVGNRILTIAPIVHFSMQDYLMLGVGPSYHDMRVRFSNDEFSDVVVTNAFATFGFLAEITAIYPPEGMVYGKINLRYHYTGEVEVGPFIINQKMEFPKSGISFNPILYTVGCGMRL